MGKIKLELDEVFSEGKDVRVELERIIERAVAKRVPLVEILTQNGELKKRALLFLAEPKVKKFYHRIERDDKNPNHILVHFRLQSNRKRIGLHGYHAS